MQDFRNRIEMRFAKFGHLVYRRAWLFLLASAIAVLAMASQLPNIKMDTSAEGLLHKKDPALMTYEAFRQQFGRDQMIIAGLNPKDVFEPRFLKKLKDFHRALEQDVPHVAEVKSLINGDFIYGENDDLIVEDLLEKLPANEKEMMELKNRILTNPLYRDVLISEDGTFTVVVIKPVLMSPAAANQYGSQNTATGTLPLLNEEEVSEFVDGVSSVCDRFQGPDFPIHLGGDVMVEEVLKRLTMRTMARFMSLTTLVIVIVFALLFRRISAVILPLLVVNCALFSTMGLMAALGAPITLNTTVLPSFLLAVGIGDSVHILAIYYQRLKQSWDKAEAISFALGHSGLAVVMTSLTTAGGLLSFVSSGIAPVADLGIFAAAGALLALIFSLVTLPALLAITPLKKRKGNTSGAPLSRLDRLLTAIGDFSTGYPRLVITISTCIFLGALLLALQLKFSHNSLHYLKEKMAVRQATELIDHKMKGSFNLEVLVDSGKPQGLYEPNVMTGIEQAQQLAKELIVDNRPVGKATAVVDIVKEINKALHGGNSAEYRIPEDRELIAQELLLYEVGGGENLDKYLDRDYQKARLTITAPWVDAIIYSKVLPKFEQKLRSLFAGQASVTMTGLGVIFVRTLSTIIHTMATSYLVAGSVITVLMILLIGNVRLGLCSMAPNFLPIVLGLGLMKILEIPLDYTTIMVGGIAIGLAVDDTVHFMHNFRRYYQQSGDAREAVRRTLTTSGRAMLFTTVILAAGFFVLLLAELNSTMNFGIITGFTICMALLADFFLAPAMMTLLTRKDSRNVRKHGKKAK